VPSFLRRLLTQLTRMAQQPRAPSPNSNPVEHAVTALARLLGQAAARAAWTTLATRSGYAHEKAIDHV